MNNLRTKILETVKQNDIRMIPKWKFVLYSTLGFAGILFTFLLVVFLGSLILFVLSRHGFMDMPFFGFMQALHSLTAIPLALLLCTIVLLVIVEIISRSYSFSFRRPLAVTLLILTSVVTLISYLISQTPVHEYIRDYMKSHNLEMLSRAYDRPAPPAKINGMDVIRGEVIMISPTSTALRLFGGNTIIAFATTTGGTSTLPFVPVVGDDIVILGTFVGDTFEIVRIRPAHMGPFKQKMKKTGKDSEAFGESAPLRTEERRQILQFQP